jgi:hypothetical protein
VTVHSIVGVPIDFFRDPRLSELNPVDNPGVISAVLFAAAVQATGASKNAS